MSDFVPHKMDRTYKIITIIGLVFEVINVFFLTLFTIVVNSYEDWFSYNPDLMTFEDYEYLITMFDILKIVFVVVLIIITPFVVLNLVLFIKLIKGTLSEESAHKVYLYQAIYGGITLLSNQIVGILYLISGVYGYKGFKEERNIRPGI
jgi:hypothetical protein